jgi:hypothetical protein
MGVFGIVLLSIGGLGTITGGFLFIIASAFMTIFSYSSFLCVFPFILVFAISFFAILPIGIILMVYGYLKAKSIMNSYFSYDAKFKKDEVTMNSQMEISFAVKL